MGEKEKGLVMREEKGRENCREEAETTFEVEMKLEGERKESTICGMI